MSLKPIVRWATGPPKSNVVPYASASYECLSIAVRQFIGIYGDRFEYYVYYNNTDLKLLRRFLPAQVNLREKRWADCVINHVGTGDHCGSTMWKWCPARVDINRHEIYMDNDIVFVKPLEKIEWFLNTDYTLLTADRFRFYGIYDKYFEPNHLFNAGFVGFQPGYDFGQALRKRWREEGGNLLIPLPDEQGLSMSVLKENKFIMITNDEIQMIHPHPDVTLNPKACAYHFAGSNIYHNTHQQYSEFVRDWRKEKKCEVYDPLTMGSLR